MLAATGPRNCPIASIRNDVNEAAEDRAEPSPPPGRRCDRCRRPCAASPSRRRVSPLRDMAAGRSRNLARGREACLPRRRLEGDEPSHSNCKDRSWTSDFQAQHHSRTLAALSLIATPVAFAAAAQQQRWAAAPPSPSSPPLCHAAYTPPPPVVAPAPTPAPAAAAAPQPPTRIGPDQLDRQRLTAPADGEPASLHAGFPRVRRGPVGVAPRPAEGARRRRPPRDVARAREPPRGPSPARAREARGAASTGDACAAPQGPSASFREAAPFRVKAPTALSAPVDLAVARASTCTSLAPAEAPGRSSHDGEAERSGCARPCGTRWRRSRSSVAYSGSDSELPSSGRELLRS